MFALGCLFPLIFGIGGIVLGVVLDGQQGAIWGGIVGAVTGCALPVAIFYGFAAWWKRRR